MTGSLPPFVIFAIGALILPLIGDRWRPAWTLFVPLAGLVNLLMIGHGVYWQVDILDYTLTFGRVDKLAFLFALLFHIATILGSIYALHVKDTVQQVSALLYAGGALGAVFAGDLLTLFIFWEVMAVASVFLIWARRTERANRSGMRYLLVQVTSGVILLAGALIHLGETGSLAFGSLDIDGLGAKLIFLSFGIKCAWPFLHSWLTDAYPEATPTGTVFLSAFTTKIAVYALARSFPGTEMLIYIGAAMAMFPIFYAVIENDLRRVLSYSLINQVGFMVVGVGLGTELALNGAVSHAFNDVVFKGLLFMSMGAVLHMTGKIDGTDLGGLYKSMPLTTTFCIVGASSISAFPLFSGFVSKSMIAQGAVDAHLAAVWFLLTAASAGVFLHAGIKFPWFVFFQKDSGLRPAEPPFNMKLAMAIFAFLCIALGVFPAPLYAMLPFGVDYVPYTTGHVVNMLQLLLFSGLAFFILLPLMKRTLTITLDTDWFYRSVFKAVALQAIGKAAWARGEAWAAAEVRIERFIAGIFRHHGPHGILARTWPTGSMVLWAAALLGASMIVYFR